LPTLRTAPTWLARFATAVDNGRVEHFFPAQDRKSASAEFPVAKTPEAGRFATGWLRTFLASLVR